MQVNIIPFVTELISLISIDNIYKVIIIFIFTLFIKNHKKIKSIIHSLFCIMTVTARKDIEYIYRRHSEYKKINIHEKLDLDKLFKAYKILGGNGKIENIYKEMCIWEVVNDENFLCDKKKRDN